jgi:hypothetical protein
MEKVCERERERSGEEVWLQAGGSIWESFLITRFAKMKRTAAAVGRGVSGRDC